ncbi:hypothetical protein AX17_004658 [Amanita inopinata Kibby_2008]|nr:hypothetical protein AX17_004658 [Amanita inopinata Kibby_2008]
MGRVQLVFDDTDSSVSYSPGWEVGGHPSLEYQGTTHGALVAGAYANVRFKGSYISVFGTLSSSTVVPTDNSTSVYIIDDGSPKVFTTKLTQNPVFQQLLFQPDVNLEDGVHTLKMVNFVGVLWFDYYTVSPSVGTLDCKESGSTVPSELVKYDDTDPSIVYSGQWTSGGTQSDWTSTLHSSGVSGSMATFDFNGTFIAVYGTLQPSDTEALAVVAFTLDGSSPSPLNRVPETRTTVQHQQILYQSPTLEYGRHRLVIALQNKSGPLFLDYFLVERPTDGNQSSENCTVPTAITTMSISSSSTQPTHGTSSSTSAVASSPHKGAIAGGILGAAAVIILICIAALFKRRLKGRTLKSDNQSVLSLSTQQDVGAQGDDRDVDPLHEVFPPRYVDGSGQPLHAYTGTTHSTNPSGVASTASVSDNLFTAAPSSPPYNPRAATYGYDEKFAAFGQSS